MIEFDNKFGYFIYALADRVFFSSKDKAFGLFNGQVEPNRAMDFHISFGDTVNYIKVE